MGERRAHTVATQCPECGWESREVPVEEGRINGEWFAFREAAEEYREHYDKKHLRPAPGIVRRSGPRG